LYQPETHKTIRTPPPNHLPLILTLISPTIVVPVIPAPLSTLRVPIVLVAELLVAIVTTVAVIVSVVVAALLLLGSEVTTIAVSSTIVVLRLAIAWTRGWRTLRIN
jgi:hypothetical protein